MPLTAANFVVDIAEASLNVAAAAVNAAAAALVNNLPSPPPVPPKPSNPPIPLIPIPSIPPIPSNPPIPSIPIPSKSNPIGSSTKSPIAISDRFAAPLPALSPPPVALPSNVPVASPPQQLVLSSPVLSSAVASAAPVQLVTALGGTTTTTNVSFLAIAAGIVSVLFCMGVAWTLYQRIHKRRPDVEELVFPPYDKSQPDQNIAEQSSTWNTEAGEKQIAGAAHILSQDKCKSIAMSDAMRSTSGMEISGEEIARAVQLLLQEKRRSIIEAKHSSIKSEFLDEKGSRRVSNSEIKGMDDPRSTWSRGIALPDKSNSNVTQSEARSTWNTEAGVQDIAKAGAVQLLLQNKNKSIATSDAMRSTWGTEISGEEIARAVQLLLRENRRSSIQSGFLDEKESRRASNGEIEDMDDPRSTWSTESGVARAVQLLLQQKSRSQDAEAAIKQESDEKEMTRFSDLSQVENSGPTTLQWTSNVKWDLIDNARKSVYSHRYSTGSNLQVKSEPTTSASHGAFPWGLLGRRIHDDNVVKEPVVAAGLSEVTTVGADAGNNSDNIGTGPTDRTHGFP